MFFERFFEMSIPISAIALMTYRLIWVEVIPALWASYLSPYMVFKNFSAIWEQAELWVQRKSIFFLHLTTVLEVVAP
jgi:hypothetical protein